MRLFTTWLSTSIAMGIGSYLASGSWFHDWRFGFGRRVTEPLRAVARCASARA